MKTFPFKLDWFAPAPAQRLAALRICLGAYSLWYLVPRISDYLEFATSDAHLFAPVGVVRLLDAPIAADSLRLIFYALLASNVAFVLGWWHRVTGPLFSLLLLATLCYRNSWSMIYHSDNVYVFHALILGFAPSADAWSLDARPRAATAEHWRYGWPIRLMCAVAVTTYFVTAIAKITGPLGWSWATGEALRGQIAVDALRKEILGSGASPLAFTLYRQVWLFEGLGVGSLATELLAPLTLLNRRAGRCWALAAFCMHWGILFIMGIKFRYQLSGMMFLPFFNVERVVWRLSELRRAVLAQRSSRTSAARAA